MVILISPLNSEIQNLIAYISCYFTAKHGHIGEEMFQGVHWRELTSFVLIANSQTPPLQRWLQLWAHRGRQRSTDGAGQYGRLVSAGLWHRLDDNAASSGQQWE